nr:trypsin-like serine protease [Longispora albida]
MRKLRTLLAAVTVAAGAVLGVGLLGTAGNAIPAPDSNHANIVGGGSATTTYSFMGSIQVGGGHYCGASLLSSQWAVTAAHCTYSQSGPLSPSQVSVRFGSNSRSSGGQLSGVSQIIRHPSYQTQYDIALLKLSSSISGAPITIASASPAANTNVRLLGWGQTCPQRGCDQGPDGLKQLDTRIISDSSCQGMNTGNELCVYGTTTNTACYGDSGGPALVSSGSGWALVGATSRSGDNNTTCGTGNAIYTDVTAFASWISQNTGGTTTPPSGTCSGNNGQAVSIPDAGAAVTSSITISGCSRAASSTSKVTVDITHSYRGDLVVDLVAPDGSTYRLKASNSNDSAADVKTTYTANLSGEAGNGTWKLRVQDVASYDTGRINSWSLVL